MCIDDNLSFGIRIRFYDIESGNIFIDGNEIQNISIKSLRDSISLVTQDVFLFNDTIYNTRQLYGPAFFYQCEIL